MATARRAPFDLWPVQFFDPIYGFAWYCGDGVIVSHVTVQHGTEAAAHAYHDYEETILREKASEVQAANGIFVLHDWRSLQSYDGEGRRAWQRHMKARRKGYLRGSVVCLVKASPLLKMAVQAANVVASVAHGAKVELADDVEACLRAHGISPPSVGRYSVRPGR
jgi:hypothetical protein